VSAVTRLSEKVELSYVRVPSHVRKIGGKVRRIKPYSYWRDTFRRTFDYEIRGRFVETQLSLNSHLNTTYTFSRTGKWGVWEPARAAQQKRVVDELWKEQFARVPSEGKAVLTGGLMGAGKTTIIHTQKHGFDPKKFGRVDADMVKERMAKHGMIPKIPGLAPLEAATLVHEESALLAAMLADRAYAERKNVIWDVSMVDSHTINSRMRKLRDAGYEEIHGVFVDIDPDTAAERVRARHRADMEKWLDKEGFGGRYVPTRLITKNNDWTGKYKSTNRAVFERERDLFDFYEVWDTSQTPAILIDSGYNDKPRTRMGY
jgi:predicted ABC-type ATPase